MEFYFQEETTEVVYDSVDDFLTGAAFGIAVGSLFFC